MPDNTYLDSEGLTALWNRIRAKTIALQNGIASANARIDTKVDAVLFDSENGKLVQTVNGATSDIVSALVLKTAMSLTKGDVGLGSVDDNAQENVLEIIKVNGSALTIDSTDKSANVIVPIPTVNSPLMDGTASLGIDSGFARGDHVHPVDTTRAPVDHSYASGTYGVGSDSLFGHLKLSDTYSSSLTVLNGIAATPKSVFDALAEAKLYADGIAEVASIGEPNVIEQVFVNDGEIAPLNKGVYLDVPNNLYNAIGTGAVLSTFAEKEGHGYLAGRGAFAVGSGTIAVNDDQVVIGRYNEPSGDYEIDQTTYTHYRLNIDEYTTGTSAIVDVSELLSSMEKQYIDSVEMADQTSDEERSYEDDTSYILGECDWSISGNNLTITYPSSGGGASGDPVTIENAYIWINVRCINLVGDDTTAFIIGNGTSDDARSNALTVDWNGNLIATGSVCSEKSMVLYSSLVKGSTPSSAVWRQLVVQDSSRGAGENTRLAGFRSNIDANGGSHCGFWAYKNEAGNSASAACIQAVYPASGSAYIEANQQIRTSSALGTGGRTSFSDASTNGCWLSSDGALSFVRSATSGGVIQFHYNFSSSTTTSIEEVASGVLRISGNLRINGHGTHIGYMPTQASASSISVPASGTWVTVTTLQLSAGVWLIVGKLQYPNLASPNQTTAYVRLGIKVDGASSDDISDERASISAAQTIVKSFRVIELSGTSTIQLRASSGAARTCSGWLNAVRIQ